MRERKKTVSLCVHILPQRTFYRREKEEMKKNNKIYVHNDDDDRQYKREGKRKEVKIVKRPCAAIEWARKRRKISERKADKAVIKMCECGIARWYRKKKTLKIITWKEMKSKKSESKYSLSNSRETEWERKTIAVVDDEVQKKRKERNKNFHWNRERIVCLMMWS